MTTNFSALIISGNSGAGKSTLIAEVVKAVPDKLRSRVLGIDERTLHHRCILKMFEDPPTWSLPIQLNFLIERAMSLTEAAENPEISAVVMERCLSEDALFFQYYIDKGAISPELKEPYDSILSAIESGCPQPTSIIHLRAHPEFLVERLNRAMDSGDREVELKGDRLNEYIVAMNVAYESWATQSWQVPYRDAWVDQATFDKGALVRSISDDLVGLLS